MIENKTIKTRIKNLPKDMRNIFIKDIKSTIESRLEMFEKLSITN